MKKSVLLIAILSASIMLCACSAGDNSVQETSSQPEMYVESNGTAVYKDNATSIVEGSLVSRPNDEPAVSAPDGSISLDKAKEILDNCAYEDLYLPQSVKEYKKFYFGTIKYNDTMYYSFYFYLGDNDKKVFLGTNCLVDCKTGETLKESWSGDYTKILQSAKFKDKSVKDVYGDQKITPNEAALVLTKFSSKQLGLEYNLSQYTFETDSQISSVESIKCYAFTPKLQYSNSIKMLTPIYVIADGTGRVFLQKTNGDFTEVK